MRVSKWTRQRPANATQLFHLPAAAITGAGKKMVSPQIVDPRSPPVAKYNWPRSNASLKKPKAALY
jgi:hypothetical protein